MATREIILEPSGASRLVGRRAKDVNVGNVERWVTGVGGAGLAVLGLKRRSAPGIAAAVVGGALVERAFSGHCPAYGALGVSTADVPRAVRVTHTVLVARDRVETYVTWRDFPNLPRFMTHLESVTYAPEGDRRTFWVARFPGLPRLRWEAEIVADEPGDRLAWQSLPGSQVQTQGSVRFYEAPAGRGTVVELWLEYEAPLGRVGTSVARALRPLTARQIERDLRRFKAVVEAGEVPTTAGQVHGH
jgi:uncharacterized membrane protein